MADPSAYEPQPVAPSSSPDDVLRVENIAKRFGPVTALRDVNLHLKKGEVLGLLGDNGAGKSTLIKIISGFQKQDSGQMFLHGQPYQPKSVDDARAKGIDTVYQDLALIDELSVYHNLFLRRERVLRGVPLLDNRKMKREARAALDEIGINIPRIDVSVARLSGGQRQAIAVARTVNSEADIILLDEPLAAMGAKEGAQILDLVARLKAEGRVSIIMILHNYVHVLEACDRVSMIQDGVIALDKPTAETSVEELTDIVVNEYRRAREAGARRKLDGRLRRRWVLTRGSGVARGRPDVDPAVDGVALDLSEFIGGEVEVRQREDILLQLVHAARADQRGAHPLIAQHPGDRQLCERLAAPRRDLVERSHAREVLLAEQLLGERLAAAHARVLRDALQVAVGEQALAQRREHDRTDAVALEDLQQAALDPTVQQRVGGLVDQQRRAEPGEDLDRLLGALRRVGADAHVQRLALPHGAVERAHRLLQRSVRIEAVRIEDVDVVEPHP